MIAASILRRARMPSSPSSLLFLPSFIRRSLPPPRSCCQIPIFTLIDLTEAKRGDESALSPAGESRSSRFARPREERPMPIARMDHFTILTTNAEKTVAFYNGILGFTSGPRPAFSFPGAWLYNDGKAVLLVVQRPS